MYDYEGVYWCICGDPIEVCKSYNGGKSCGESEGG